MQSRLFNPSLLWTYTFCLNPYKKLPHDTMQCDPAYLLFQAGCMWLKLYCQRELYSSIMWSNLKMCPWSLQALAAQSVKDKNKRKPVCKQTSLPPNFTFNVRPPSPDYDEDSAGMNLLGIKEPGPCINLKKHPGMEIPIIMINGCEAVLSL